MSSSELWISSLKFKFPLFILISVLGVQITTYFAQQIQACYCLGNILLTGQEQLSSTAMEAETIQIFQVTLETVFRNMSVCVYCVEDTYRSDSFFLHAADCLTYIESQGSLAYQLCSCNACKCSM